MALVGAEQGELNWKLVIDMYTVLYIKQITNKNLLYSAGNSTQHSAMAYAGKESKTVGICMHIIHSLCSIPETNTAL